MKRYVSYLTHVQSKGTDEIKLVAYAGGRGKSGGCG